MEGKLGALSPFYIRNPLLNLNIYIMKRFKEIVTWWLANSVGASDKEMLWQQVHNDLMIEVWDELDEYYANKEMLRLQGH